MSDTSYTVCSGLHNHCLKSNTIRLLRDTFFDEISMKLFYIKALILKSTPVDLIISRNTIKKFNLFDRVPSQLKGKLLILTLDPTPKGHNGLYD